MDVKFIGEIKRLEDVELQEGDDTKEDIYKFLLVFYLLDDQSMKAKFLWKRIPANLKQVESNELNKIWKICQNLITRKYPVAFQFANIFNEQWSTNELRNLVNKLIEITKEKIFNLITVAYSSISVNDLAATLNLSPDETVKIAISQNWSLDETKVYLIPEKKHKEIQKIPSSLKQLHQLTSVVSYLDS